MFKKINVTEEEFKAQVAKIDALKNQMSQLSQSLAYAVGIDKPTIMVQAGRAIGDLAAEIESALIALSYYQIIK